MNCNQIMVLLFSKEWNLVFATTSNCLVPISLQPEAEFKEFKSRLKSAKTRFKLSAGLNLETFDTILSETNHN